MTLEQTWCTALGQALYDQSRERAQPEHRSTGRSKITLARSVGADFTLPNVDDDEESSDESKFVVDLA